MLNIAKVPNSLATLLLMVVGASLSACGGSDSPATAAATDPSPSTSISSSGAIALSGTPGVSATVDQPYSFYPSATSSLSAVTFSISNKPVWASFNVLTGALTGTPTAAHVGTYSNIVIAANTGTSSASLPAFAVAVVQVGSNSGSATLSWTPPTQNTDGTAMSNLAGYHIYYGTSADSMTRTIQITNPGLTAYTIADLGVGTHYFGISAYTTAGTESDLSSIGSKTVM